jgi:hypothetical protein
MPSRPRWLSSFSILNFLRRRRLIRLSWLLLVLELSCPKRFGDALLPRQWSHVENHLIILSNDFQRPPIDILQGCKRCDENFQSDIETK